MGAASSSGIAEHHIAAPQWQQYKGGWANHHWQPYIQEAQPLDSGGTSGGVSLAYRTGTASEALPGSFDHRWTATIYRTQHMEVIVGVLYLKVGEGQSKTFDSSGQPPPNIQPPLFPHGRLEM